MLKHVGVDSTRAITRPNVNNDQVSAHTSCSSYYFCRHITLLNWTVLHWNKPDHAIKPHSRMCVWCMCVCVCVWCMCVCMCVWCMRYTCDFCMYIFNYWSITCTDIAQSFRFWALWKGESLGYQMIPILTPYDIAGSLQKLSNTIFASFPVSSVDYATIAIDYVIA